MSTPAAKRRRLGDASNTLSKPFRSPFKVLQPPPSTSHVSNISSGSSSERMQEGHCRPVFSPLNSTAQSRPAGTASPQLPSNAQLNADPFIAPLIKAQRALEKQLRLLREELEASEQARGIEFESLNFDPDGETDAELKGLTKKWRSASRQAAEELLGSTRDKVNRMGGPKAWRESQARQKEFLESYNEPEPELDSDDSQREQREDREERDLYAEYSIDPETEYEREARGGNDLDDGPNDVSDLASIFKSNSKKY